MPLPTRLQRFQVIDQLGSGGMGSVYRARDPQLERDVAIKVLDTTAVDPRDLSASDTLDLRSGAAPARDDLLGEARIMARLSHPNVLPVFEVGLADDAVFLVMEHVAGRDLRGWLATPRTVAEVVAVFAEAGRGLAAAHAHGIVHRDFKPDNVLIGDDGRVRVADFGLSRLRSSTALVQIDDGRGTPYYMAPELWQGGAATPASDVYAFCVALAEALGGEPSSGASIIAPTLDARGVDRALRDAVIAGLADDPAARPELGRVIDALVSPARRPSRRRWWLAGGAAACAVAGAAIVVATRDGSAACEPDPSRFIGRWDAPRRAALDQAVAGADPAPLVRALDDTRRALGDGFVATCTALADGGVTRAQAGARDACLERRAIELGGVVARVIDGKLALLAAPDRVRAIPRAAECAELAGPPLTDPAATSALYARLLAAEPIGSPAGSTIDELAAIERDAARAREPELEARAATLLGVRLWQADRLADADQAFQRAYRRALEIHAGATAVVALGERSVLATLRADATAARGYAELALELAKRPTISARARARAYEVLGHADRERGDILLALDKLREARRIIADSGEPNPHTELDARLEMIAGLGDLEGKLPEAIALGQDTVELARTAFGEQSNEHAIALNVLSFTHRKNGDVASALPLRRHSLAIMVATLPAGHSQVQRQRANLAADLSATGEFEQARQLLEAALAHGEHNEGLDDRAEMLGDLAAATFQVGRHAEGLALLDQSVELFTSRRGKDHPMTAGYRLLRSAFEMEVGKLDEAERDVAAAEASYRARAEPSDVRLAGIRGLNRAWIALLRGRPRDAEQLVRSALAVWSELHGDEDSRASLWNNLGTSLADQGRWAEARAAVDTALAIVSRRPGLDERFAGLELEYAKIEAGLGHRAAAVGHARRAREILERFPGSIVWRRQADALLARLH